MKFSTYRHLSRFNTLIDARINRFHVRGFHFRWFWLMNRRWSSYVRCDWNRSSFEWHFICAAMNEWWIDEWMSEISFHFFPRNIILPIWRFNLCKLEWSGKKNIPRILTKFMSWKLTIQNFVLLTHSVILFYVLKVKFFTTKTRFFIGFWAITS